MARKPTIDSDLVNKAQEIAKDTKCASTLRLCQSVLLPARIGATLEETAAILGVGRATVPRMQKTFRAQFAESTSAPPRNWGGRRHQLMSPTQEKDFLQPWLEKAASGGMVVVSPIRAALAQHLKKPVAASVVYKLLARHGWRKVAPDTPKATPRSKKTGKKLPKDLAAILQPEVVKDRKVKILFQDEARFGRMVRIRRCWAPMPLRPVVDNGYERQFTYVYGAVNPAGGEFDWMLAEKMNTETFSTFLAQVAAAHPEDFMVMIVDGASSHVSKELIIPENIRLYRLPPYSPELNPVEHLWDEIREKSFPNRVFSEMKAVIAQLEKDLPALALDAARVNSITAWPWIISLNLKEN